MPSLKLFAVEGAAGEGASGNWTIPMGTCNPDLTLSSRHTSTTAGKTFTYWSLVTGTNSVISGYMDAIDIPTGWYWMHDPESGYQIKFGCRATGQVTFGPVKYAGSTIGAGASNTGSDVNDRVIVLVNKSTADGNAYYMCRGQLSSTTGGGEVRGYGMAYAVTFEGIDDLITGDNPYEPPGGQAGAGSTPGGGGDAGQGNGFPDGTNVGVPDSKKDRASAACANIYLCSAGAVKAFTQCLWGSTNTGFIDAFFKRVQNTVYNPIESVITCHSLPTAFTPGAGVNTGLKAGGVDFSAYDPVAVGGIVTSEWVNWNSSVFSVAECWASYADYNHMAISLHLPFCGVVPLEPSEVVGGSVQVVYWCNVLNGNCAAFIVATDRDGDSKVVKVATGNCAQPCPISGNDRGMQQKLGAAVGFAQGTLSAAAGALSGNSSNFDLLGNYIKFGTNWALAPQHTSVVGSLAGAVGFAGSTDVFIILDYEYPIETENYNAMRGRPSDVSGVVSGFPGYAELELHADGIATATEAEKRQIEQFCRQGVIV